MQFIIQNRGVNIVKKYLALDELWKCETCFHYRSGECAPRVWCEHGESYRPAYDKLEIVLFDENDIKMKF